MARSITLKQDKFVLAMLDGMTATDAYVHAYNTERMKRESIINKAYELSNSKVIQDRMAELRKPVIEKAQLTLEAVIRENMKLAFFDVRTMFDERGALKPVSEWDEAIGGSVSSIEVFEEFAGSGQNRVKIGETKKVKFWDKGAAIDKLMKHLGGYEQDNKQKENNPMFLFVQQLMGSALPVVQNPHLIDAEVLDDDE